MKLFSKIKKLFFDYEEIGPEYGYKLSLLDLRNGDYFFIVKSPSNHRYLLYRYSNRRSVENFEKFITGSPELANRIKYNFKYYLELPTYKFYRIKNKFCVVNKMYDEDIWLSSATRLGNFLLLFSVFSAGSAILLVLFYIFKAVFKFLFM